MARGGIFAACMSASVARAAGVGTSYGAAGVGGDGASRARPAAFDELREETAREAALNEVFRKEFAREQRRLQRSVDDIVDAAKRGGIDGGRTGGGGGGGGRAGRAGNARWSGCAAVSATLVLACVAALAALAYFGGIDDVVAMTIAPIAQSNARGGAPSARARDAPRGAHPFAARMRRDFEQSRREVRDLHRKLDETTAREERLEGSLSPWALTASLSPDPPRYLRDEDEATWKAREKAEADAKAKEAEKANEKAAKRDEDADFVAEKKDEPSARSSRASRKATAPRRAGGGKASSSRA
ncbi:predicted protein [Micromonas commoda]|uniref:Uncharacterized protein n=1 Tax=Micromonas commoda (strain RCC299 / NOUM17 / CCMP2709) TaxID=296587 RepID=C1FI66_MICCC|nr:predicted protein [Micromonas commoda]ACO69940.1 predicted protein [Micromonas commoda]|eukprot:XP_002508682.1 predicted protein [Micromonas commoda]